MAESQQKKRSALMNSLIATGTTIGFVIIFSVILMFALGILIVFTQNSIIPSIPILLFSLGVLGILFVAVLVKKKQVSKQILISMVTAWLIALVVSFILVSLLGGLSA